MARGQLMTARRVAIGVAVVACAAEIAVRLSGVLDFPTYLVDDDIGYIIKPSQSGSFLHRNPWVFNDRSMGRAENWNPQRRPDLLLIGNSIIMGGNPYRQQDKVGPIVQRELGEQLVVWPAAVGGWTQVNETAYLERNPDVVAANSFFVWEVMRGGFGQQTLWPGDYVFPRARPVCGSCYVFRRYLLPRLLALHESELPAEGPGQTQNIERFEKAIGALCRPSHQAIPGVLLLYPRQAELALARQGLEWFPDRQPLERIASQYGLRVVDLTQQPGWDDSKYRGDGTHPSVEGNAFLGHLIATVVKSSMQ
jgi:hypothetical protein